MYYYGIHNLDFVIQPFIRHAPSRVIGVFILRAWLSIKKGLEIMLGLGLWTMLESDLIISLVFSV